LPTRPSAILVAAGVALAAVIGLGIWRFAPREAEQGGAVRTTNAPEEPVHAESEAPPIEPTIVPEPAAPEEAVPVARPIRELRERPEPAARVEEEAAPEVAVAAHPPRVQPVAEAAVTVAGPEAPTESTPEPPAAEPPGATEGAGVLQGMDSWRRQEERRRRQ